MSDDIEEVITNADVLVVAVPSAFVKAAFEHLPKDVFQNKKIVSAIKGILPDCNDLLNDYLGKIFRSTSKIILLFSVLVMPKKLRLKSSPILHFQVLMKGQQPPLQSISIHRISTPSSTTILLVCNTPLCLKTFMRWAQALHMDFSTAIIF